MEIHKWTAINKCKDAAKRMGQENNANELCRTNGARIEWYSKGKQARGKQGQHIEKRRRSEGNTLSHSKSGVAPVAVTGVPLGMRRRISPSWWGILRTCWEHGTHKHGWAHHESDTFVVRPMLTRTGGCSSVTTRPFDAIVGCSFSASFNAAMSLPLPADEESVRSAHERAKWRTANEAREKKNDVQNKNKKAKNKNKQRIKKIAMDVMNKKSTNGLLNERYKREEEKKKERRKKRKGKSGKWNSLNQQQSVCIGKDDATYKRKKHSTEKEKGESAKFSRRVSSHKKREEKTIRSSAGCASVAHMIWRTRLLSVSWL